MKFSSLGGMFSHYYEVREALRSPRTNMPQPESLRQEIFSSNPERARDSIEYKRAFIGDVDIFLVRLEWWEAIIIKGRLVAPGDDQISFGKLSRALIDDGRHFPRKLKSRNNLFVEYRDIIKPNAEVYFRERGYLR